jgi:hypothetical protein
MFSKYSSRTGRETFPFQKKKKKREREKKKGAAITR